MQLSHAARRVAVARQAWRMSAKKRRAYPEYLAGTETGAAIKPVIIPEFVDLDPFATVGRLQVQRHDPARNGRLVTPGLSRMSVRRCECHLESRKKVTWGKMRMGCKRGRVKEEGR